MKLFLPLLLSALSSFSALAQSVNEPEGEKFIQMQIVVNKEFFKLPDSTHKELLGSSLQAIVYQDNQQYGANGGEIQKVQVGSFEVHVQGDNLGSISIADIHAAAVRYLYVTNTDGGVGVSVDLKGVKFDYKNYSLNEPADKNLKYSELSVVDVRPGLRLSGKNSYIVIGGVAAFGPVFGHGKKSLERLKLGSDFYETQEIFNREHDNDGSPMAGSVGAYADINLGDKFKVSGSATWRSRNKIDGRDYETKEQVMVEVPVEKVTKGDLGDWLPAQTIGGWQVLPGSLQDQVKTVEKTKISNRNFGIYSQRFNLQVNFESDLGKLISPALTGVSVTGGVNVNRYKFTIDWKQNSWELEGVSGTNEDVIQFKNEDVYRYNQVQFNIGLKLNLNEMGQHRKTGKKYREMADMF